MPAAVEAVKMKIVDVDTHLSEPHDIFTSRAPRKYKDSVPQVKMIKGKPTWVAEGDKVMAKALACSVIKLDGSKGDGLSVFKNLQEDVHPGSYDAKARVRVMDELGISAQIMYPNLLGFGGQKVPATDPVLRNLCVTLYNDAMAEFQETSGNRIFPMALLPWWDMDAAVAEAARCKKMGLRGVNTNSDPNDAGLPDLGDPHWEPLWTACEDLNLPINFHIGASDSSRTWFGGSAWPSRPRDQKLALGGTMLFMQNARVICNIIYAGICERHPRLKFVSVESGVGWIPFILECLDYQAIETAHSALKVLSMKPSDYFKRQMYGCFWFEQENLATVARQVGVDNLMFETDFPHPTCLYPNVVEFGTKAVAGLEPDEQRKLLGGNAISVYSLPV